MAQILVYTIRASGTEDTTEHTSTMTDHTMYGETRCMISCTNDSMDIFDRMCRLDYILAFLCRGPVVIDDRNVGTDSFVDSL